jgi:hypothetical protein
MTGCLGPIFEQQSSVRYGLCGVREYSADCWIGYRATSTSYDLPVSDVGPYFSIAEATAGVLGWDSLLAYHQQRHLRIWIESDDADYFSARHALSSYPFGRLP